MVSGDALSARLCRCAGFVIGIRLVSEWFPAREVGIAEGIYGGWGNFGAAVASMTMPIISLSVWR
jgi:NNP family nitrate/nitrite transporter-like MFS transporter